MHLIDRVEVRNNPVARPIHINIFDVIQNVVKDKTVPLFKPYTSIDFFKRAQFQQRVHVLHILLLLTCTFSWLNGVPHEGNSRDMTSTVDMVEALTSFYAQ